MTEHKESLEEYERQGFLKQETVHGAFMKTAEKYADKTAVIDGDGSMTYQQLNKYSDLLAAYFLRNGLQKGDNVLLQIPNSNQYVAVLLALLKAGVIPALLLPTHREKEAVSIANAIQPKAYIGVVECLGVQYAKMIDTLSQKDFAVPLLFTDREFFGNQGRQYFTLPAYREDQEEVPFCAYQTDARSVALYLLSGGTTNMPKVIPRIHEAYVCNSKSSTHCLGITEDSVYMAVLSTSHDYPLASPGILGTLYAGGTVVSCQTAGFDEAFSMIEEHGVTVTCIVPAIAQIWVEVLNWYEGDFSSLQNIAIGAAKLDRKLGQALMDKLGVKLQQGYGSGEGVICYTSLDDDLEVVLSTQGKPASAGDCIRIVDEKGNQLPPYEQGELLEKGPYVFLGYYGNEQLNREAFTSDGFFRTGDKAYLDEYQNIVICGRVREQINRAGENVSPVEIETILRTHSEIKAAAVFGREDADLGERTTAVLVTENKNLSLGDISKFFMENGVAQYKIPDEIHIREELVYTNVGKVDKKKLKKMLEESEQERWS